MKLLIIGCGRMGAGLAQALARRGHDLTLIDTDPDAFARLDPSVQARRLVGFGLDRELLEEAGMDQVDGLAAVTGSDEVNVVVARVARRHFHVPRIVARVYDPGKAEIYRRLGIVTISPIAWGVNRLTDALAFPELEVVASLGSGDVELVEIEVSSRLAGRTVREINVPGHIQVVALKRGAHFQLPAPGVALAAHDLLCLAVMPDAVERLKAMLGLI